MSHFVNVVLLPLSLFIIMLGVGLSTKKSDFLQLNSQKLAIVGGFFLQVVGLPLLAFVLLKLFAVSDEYAVALMIVACCSGGVTSNAITYIFSGVVALSVVLTLLTSLIAPATLPLLTNWSLLHFTASESSHHFALLPTVTKLFVLSIVPIMIGNVVQWFAPQWCEDNSGGFRRFSGGLFIGVLLLMAWVNAALLIKVVAEVGVFIVVMVCCAIALGFYGAKLLQLNRPTQLTLAIEVGIQNAGMGLVITGTVLNNPTMSMTLIAYGIVMQIPLFIFATWYRQCGLS